MTRINCVPPAELCREHLLAEYRELPRVVALAARAYARRAALRLPESYRLGAGHVLFFYARLGWVERRFAELVAEMRRRGYAPRFEQLPPADVGPDWRADWTPDAAAIELNRQRINLRLAQMKERS